MPELTRLSRTASAGMRNVILYGLMMFFGGYEVYAGGMSLYANGGVGLSSLPSLLGGLGVIGFCVVMLRWCADTLRVSACLYAYTLHQALMDTEHQAAAQALSAAMGIDGRDISVLSALPFQAWRHGGLSVWWCTRQFAGEVDSLRDPVSKAW